MVTSTPPRRKHRLTWFVVLLGLLEIAAIVAFIELKGFASTVCSATVAVQHNGNGALPFAGGEMQGGSGGGDATSAQSPLAAPSVLPQPAESGEAAHAPAAQAGDATVQGDTNQIVDPKCVANAATAALSSGPAPSTPTCGPMTQPAALKQAEQQISK